MKVFVKHYQVIFVAHPLTSVRVDPITECKFIIPQNSSLTQRNFCDASLSLEDLKVALSQMANDKAPISMASLVNFTKIFGT